MRPAHHPSVPAHFTSCCSSHQEDFYAYSALSLDPAELALSFKKAHNIDWDPSELPPTLARQVLFVGIYDGHGGSTVSQFLRQELHGLFENVHKEQIPELYAWTKELGGYFRRFNGGVLAPWIDPDSPDFQRELDLEARATLAFFEVRAALSDSPHRTKTSTSGGQDPLSGARSEGMWRYLLGRPFEVPRQSPLWILPSRESRAHCRPRRVCIP